MPGWTNSVPFQILYSSSFIYHPMLVLRGAESVAKYLTEKKRRKKNITLFFVAYFNPLRPCGY
jgi:hypothetical protein